MAFTGITTAGLLFSGFPPFSQPPASARLVIAASVSFSSETNQLSALVTVEYSLDGGATWTNIFSGPGNNGLISPTTSTSSVSLNISLPLIGLDPTKVQVRFTPWVNYDANNTYYRMWNIFDVSIMVT